MHTKKTGERIFQTEVLDSAIEKQSHQVKKFVHCKIEFKSKIEQI